MHYSIVLLYLPTQKCLKILPNTSLGVIWPPVISARVSGHDVVSFFAFC